MGAIAALLALGGIVALAAYSAADREPPAGPPPSGPPSGGFPPPPPFAPTSTTSPGGGDPYTATPIPSHCPADLSLADPTVRALCGPSAPSPDSAAIVPVNTAMNVPPDLVQRVRTFMESDPTPEQIEELATQLERAGLPDAARQLREVAATRRAQAAPSPAPSPAPPPPPAPAPAPTPPAFASAPDPQPDPPSPAGTPGTSSSSATDSDSSPRPADSGEPLSGRQLAANVAAALRDRLSEIQRITRAFQAAANITTDGLYGPLTRAALTYWSGRTAPRPWVGSGSPRYVMNHVAPGDGSPEAANAERTARQLFAALVEPEGDARPQVERFQRTVGLTVDGKYGQQTRAALGRLGVANPPVAFRRTRARTGARSSGGSSRRRSGRAR